jgi:replication factor A1
MTISVNDAFGQAWFSCFDDVGRLIMGKTADELEELKEKSQLGEIDSQEYENCFTSALCKAYTFRCRAKKDTYNDQDRVRISIMSAAPLNYSAEITKLFERVKLYA